MRALALCAATLALSAAPARAHPLVVVELFTSQGCSSCPPADAFLTELAHDPGLLPLAFHVTYWNGLGWSDPYALDAATTRQQAYVRSLGGEAYTPQMVVNGAVSLVGSNRDAARAAIAAAAPPTAALLITRNPGGLTVELGAGAGPATILLVGYDRQHRTPIGRGENGGRTLLESNIVRTLIPIGRTQGTAAIVHHAAPAGERVAALAQSDTGAIIAAALLDAPPS